MISCGPLHQNYWDVASVQQNIAHSRGNGSWDCLENLTQTHLHINRPCLSSDFKIRCCNNYPKHLSGVIYSNMFAGDAENKFWIHSPVSKKSDKKPQTAFLLTRQTPLFRDANNKSNQRLAKKTRWVVTSLCHFCCLPFSHSHLPWQWQWHGNAPI